MSGLQKRTHAYAHNKKEILMWLMGDDVCEPQYLRYSLNIVECSSAVCADAFSDLCFCLEDDGVMRSTKYKAPATVTRYRRACAQFCLYVVDRELLTKNPWPAGKRGKSTRKEKGKGDLRIDLLPTNKDAVDSINAVASHQPRSRAYKVVCALGITTISFTYFLAIETIDTGLAIVMWYFSPVTVVLIS